MSYELSLAQWSLHRSIRSGEIRGRDFPRVAREMFDIGVIELVNHLLDGGSRQVLAEMKRQACDVGVKFFMIMVDDEGDLSHRRPRVRRKAVHRHQHWIEVAADLGCTAVRVNTGGDHPLAWNTPLENGVVQSTLRRCLDSCTALADFARPAGVSILLENHGGLSSNIPAVVDLIQRAQRGNLGTLPDFGNFSAAADKYDSIERLLPFALGVSAKTFDFDDEGLETTIDYPRMVKMIEASGYEGYIGIEYEGKRLDEAEGVRRSKTLLEKILPLK